MKNLSLVFIEDGLSEAELENIRGGAGFGCPKLTNCDKYVSGGECTALLQCTTSFTSSIMRPSGGTGASAMGINT